MPISENCNIHFTVKIHHPDLVNIYDCKIGSKSTIGPFVEIQKDVLIGSKCKISSHSFICEGVTIEDGVFIGHGVMFINDVYPRAITNEGKLQSEDDWDVIRITVKKGSSIGSNATIMAGVNIGKKSIVGAGAVVVEDVSDFSIVAGVPAKVIGDVRNKK